MHKKPVKYIDLSGNPNGPQYCCFACVMDKDDTSELVPVQNINFRFEDQGINIQKATDTCLSSIKEKVHQNYRDLFNKFVENLYLQNQIQLIDQEDLLQEVHLKTLKQNYTVETSNSHLVFTPNKQFHKSVHKDQILGLE